jgi:hypothetical protein
MKGYYPEKDKSKKRSSGEKDVARPKTRNDMDELLESDFDYFLFVLFSAFLKFDADSEKLSKDDAIRFFYDVIRDYKPFQEKGKNKLSSYKLFTIVGILSEEVGYKLSNKKNLSSQEIFQAVRNAIKKHTLNDTK